MRHVLRRHPDSPCSAATQIAVEIARPRPDHLQLSYVVTGRIGDIRMPPVAAAARSDGLWRQTCFEAFVRASAGSAYYEFNFAPSTHWAAYQFDDYRSGMAMADAIAAPAITVQTSPDRYALHTSLALDRLPALPRTVSWGLSLSAVIEETNGRKSYWALAHPPGAPDFHHSVCFAHEFSPG